MYYQSDMFFRDTRWIHRVRGRGVYKITDSSLTLLRFIGERGMWGLDETIISDR